MKKLLVLVLVLVLTPFVGASVMSIGAVADGVTADHLLTISETDVAGAERYYALVCNVADATISGGAIVPAGVDFSVYDNAAGSALGGIGTMNGIWGGFYNTSGAMPLGTYLNSIKLDFAAGVTSATVYLYEVDLNAWSATELLDSIVVPEPATMVLLGLGGLLLRRKK